MVMNKPTEEQVKEFWEWYGFKVSIGKLYWAPKQDEPAKRLPTINLNSLFRYAVPKLGKILIEKNCLVYTFSIVGAGGNILAFNSNSDPALALFWSIWEVIHANN